MTSKTTMMAMLLGCATAWGQPGLAPPRMGYALQADGSVRPVVGTSANFLLGDALVKEAISAASSGKQTLVKKAEELWLLDAEGQRIQSWPAPHGKIHMAFTRQGEAAAVYFVETRELARVEGGELTPVPFEAEVVSMAAPRRGAVTLLVRRGEELWQTSVQTASGEIREEHLLPGVGGPALLRSDGTLIYMAAGELVVRQKDATEKHVEVDATVLGIEELGGSWVALHVKREGATGERRMALHVKPNEEQLYELPEVPR
jgi:hypothetical protein